MILLILNRDESKGTLLYKGCLLFVISLYVIHICLVTTQKKRCSYMSDQFTFSMAFLKEYDY